jgi:hypothetical protein
LMRGMSFIWLFCTGILSTSAGEHFDEDQRVDALDASAVGLPRAC